MKRRVKTYQATRYITYSTRVIVDGRVLPIKFTGGVSAPNKRPGKYTTDNEAIQEALEKANEYNLNYRLIYDSGELEYDDESSELKLREIPEITTVVGAKKFLLDRFKNLSASKLKNKATVIKVAKQHGIVFPDLLTD